jgi:hypothetical protein
VTTGFDVEAELGANGDDESQPVAVLTTSATIDTTGHGRGMSPPRGIRMEVNAAAADF